MEIGKTSQEKSHTLGVKASIF